MNNKKGIKLWSLNSRKDYVLKHPLQQMS
jgi:hypothetical protein